MKVQNTPSADLRGRRIIRRAVALAAAGAAVAAAAVVIPAAANAADAPSTTVTRLGGVDRYGTAQEIAQAEWPNGASTVYLAYGLNFPDALAGVPLAAQTGAPILLTDTNTVSAATLAELTALKAKNVSLLGGTGVISSSVVSTLQAAGYTVTQTLWGADRYATATAVGTALLKAEGTTASTTAVLATGGTFADALSIGPVAGADGWPILFTQVNSLPATTSQFITANKITSVVIVGGTGAVSPAVAGELTTLGVTTINRYGGADRYATSVQIAQQYGSQLNTGLSLATGTDFADALTGGVLSAKLKMPLLLLNPNTAGTQNTGAVGTTPGLTSTNVYVYGGTGALPDNAVQAVSGIVPGTPTITGTAAIGQTLTATPGTWTPSTVVPTLQWQWYDGTNPIGAPTTGATSSYTVTASDVGYAISVKVTGTSGTYKGVGTSAPTTVIQGTPFTTDGTGTVSITGTAGVGQTLTANVGTDWTPAITGESYQWLSGGQVITGATSSTYTPVTADLGKKISVQVTVWSNTGVGPKTVPSAATDPIALAFNKAPKPTIAVGSGTLTAGTANTLTANAGQWDPTPTTLTYQWFKIPQGQTAAESLDAASATNTSLSVSAPAAGDTYYVVVTGSLTGYATTTVQSAVVTVSTSTSSPSPSE